jgi:hypothetical protein
VTGNQVLFGVGLIMVLAVGSVRSAGIRVPVTSGGLTTRR